jgi:hypothetical protein
MGPAVGTARAERVPQAYDITTRCVVMQRRPVCRPIVGRIKIVTTSSVNLSLHDGSASWLDKFPSIQVSTENELMLSPVSPHALVTIGRTRVAMSLPERRRNRRLMAIRSCLRIAGVVEGSERRP